MSMKNLVPTNQGFTSDLFCNNQGKQLFSVQPLISKLNIEAISKESNLVPLISKIGAMNVIQFVVLSIDPGLIYLY